VYGVNSNPWEVMIMIVFGIVGYLMRKLKYEPARSFLPSFWPSHGRIPQAIALPVQEEVLVFSLRGRISCTLMVIE